MKLAKAIEMLFLKPITGDKALDKDMADAMKLGIKALTYTKAARGFGLHHTPTLLNGETPPDDSP